MRSPNFSTFRQAWKGSCNSEPLITILGKSSKCTWSLSRRGISSQLLHDISPDKVLHRNTGLFCNLPKILQCPRSRICTGTSSGSNMPFRVTMICLGCSSTGRDRIKAATSSAVFHLASYRKTAGLEKNLSADSTVSMRVGIRDSNQILKIRLEFMACSRSVTRPSISFLLITEGSSHSWSSVTPDWLRKNSWLHRLPGFAT